MKTGNHGGREKARLRKEAAAYVRTDLAAECRTDRETEELPGVDYREETVDGIRIARLTVKEGEGERSLGKPAGNYVTLLFGRLWLSGEEEVAAVSRLLAKELRDMAAALAPAFESVLVAGLGNRLLTADAVGPRVADAVTVTRHLKEMDPTLYARLGQCCVSALAPGVLGQTGMETASLLAGAAQVAKPDLVIAVDALAARSTDRLCCSVQLSDCGIRPGSGVGNARRALTKETLGAPVISLGVPTVAESSTLLFDALSEAGIEELDDRLRQVLDKGRGFFVAVKDCDAALESLSSLVAGAVDAALRRSGAAV